MTYDVAIIGAGAIGCAVARELSRYDCKTVLIEKENDVAMGTTCANSAIIHAGYDPNPAHLWQYIMPPETKWQAKSVRSLMFPSAAAVHSFLLSTKTI